MTLLSGEDEVGFALSSTGMVLKMGLRQSDQLHPQEAAVCYCNWQRPRLNGSRVERRDLLGRTTNLAGYMKKEGRLDLNLE